MPVVDYPAGDVEMGDGIAVEQELLVNVIEQKRCNGEDAQHKGEARLGALLLELLLEFSAGVTLRHSNSSSNRNTRV